MADFQILGDNPSVFDPLLLFNEVLVANFVEPFNFNTGYYM